MTTTDSVSFLPPRCFVCDEPATALRAPGEMCEICGDAYDNNKTRVLIERNTVMQKSQDFDVWEPSARDKHHEAEPEKDSRWCIVCRGGIQRTSFDTWIHS